MSGNGHLEEVDFSAEVQVLESVQRDTHRTAPEFGAMGMGVGSAIDDAFWLRFPNKNTPLPAWWSRARDMFLRRYVRASIVLGSVTYGRVSQIKNMDWKLIADDPALENELPRYYDLLSRAHFGNGFRTFLELWASDNLTQDNGAFIEFIGQGQESLHEDMFGNVFAAKGYLDKKDIIGFAHVDAAQCWRTLNLEYPVVYINPYSGQRTILHYTRVAARSQFRQTQERARGIGVCAASRAFTAIEIAESSNTYLYEKLTGQAPEIAVLNGVQESKIKRLLEASDIEQDNKARLMYKGVLFVGGDTGTTPPDIKIVGLKSTPDGYDREKELNLAIYLTAMAYTTDPRDLGWAIGVTGATKADAEMQDVKTSGRGRSDTLKDMEELITTRLLPSGMRLEFDAKDDLEDQRRALIRQTRAATRAAQIASGELTVEEARELAAKEEDIDPAFLKHTLVVQGDSNPSLDQELETGEQEVPTLKAYNDEIRIPFQDNLMQLLLNVSDPYKTVVPIEDMVSDYGQAAYLKGINDGGARGIVNVRQLESEEVSEMNAGIAMMNSRAFGLAADALDLELPALQERVYLWANKGLDSLYNAGLLSGNANANLKWKLGETEKHCFVAGTLIDTNEGKKPIESILAGDKVLTLEGYKVVTKVWERPYQGEMCEIISQNGTVQATANHPFLTQRGWIAAGSLKESDKIVLQKNALDSFFVHIAFPYSINFIPTGLKVFILRLITLLLLLLPFSQRFKTRMTMPIIAVGLDDDGLDSTIYNEFGLDKEIWLIEDAKFIKNGKQLLLQLSRFIFLKFGMSLKKTLYAICVNIWMLLTELANFCFYLISFHWIIAFHSLLSYSSDELISSFWSQSQSKFIRFIMNARQRDPQQISTKLSTARWIIVNDRLFKFNRVSLRIAMTLFAGIGIPIAYMTTNGANTSIKASPFGGNGLQLLLMGAIGIAALYTTKAFGILRSNWLATQFTIHDLSPNNGFQLNHYTTQDEIKVYNLSVDNVEHYVANGFLVHNCTDCQKVDGRVYRAKTWKKYGWQPKSGDLACGGWRCDCSLEKTEDPVTRGRPPELSSRKKWYSHAH